MTYDWESHDRRLLTIVNDAIKRIEARHGTGVLRIKYNKCTARDVKTSFGPPREDVLRVVPQADYLSVLCYVAEGAYTIRSESGFGEQRLDFDDGNVIRLETTVRDHLPKPG